jgi:hypothetical protein
MRTSAVIPIEIQEDSIFLPCLDCTINGASWGMMVV